MAIAALTNAELNNNWMYAALRVQASFNTAALAALPDPIGTINVLTPIVVDGGEVSAIRALRKAISAALVTSTRPAITEASGAITNVGWKYILADLISKANTSLATDPV